VAESKLLQISNVRSEVNLNHHYHEEEEEDMEPNAIFPP
jgi:hypothetical protein